MSGLFNATATDVFRVLTISDNMLKQFMLMKKFLAIRWLLRGPDFNDKFEPIVLGRLAELDRGPVVTRLLIAGVIVAISPPQALGLQVRTSAPFKRPQNGVLRP